MSIMVMSAKASRVPGGAELAFSETAVAPDAKVSGLSVASPTRPDVLVALGLRKIDLFMFGLAAIWCAFGAAKIIIQF